MVVITTHPNLALSANWRCRFPRQVPAVIPAAPVERSVTNDFTSYDPTGHMCPMTKGQMEGRRSLIIPDLQIPVRSPQIHTAVKTSA